MKVMAEAFSNAGVPVFLCDVKGDVSELAMPGEALLPGTETSSEFLFSEDGSRSVIIGPKGVTWDYDENGVAVFTEDCEQKMAENQGYLWEQGRTAISASLDRTMTRWQPLRRIKATDIQRSMTKISDYLLQNVPVMVFSATQEEFDQKYAEIQAELKNMGYDEVNAYFEEAWEKAKAEYAELMGK